MPMFKRILFAVTALILISAQNISSQHLLSDSLLVHYSVTDVDSIFNANGVPFPAPYGVSCYRIIYSTLNARQTDTTVASGLVVVPDTAVCPLPMTVYDHGTTLQKADVPSGLSDESQIAIILSEQGYFVIAPDYLGLGVSPGLHPYLHARSEAQAGIDMIFAAKQFAVLKNVSLDEQLFLTGYSQGGHACMATHRAIQQNYAGQLTVTASEPCSGPYNLSGVQATGTADSNYYVNPSGILYVAFAFQSVYGNLYDSVQQFLLPPYDSILPPLFNGLYSQDFIDSLMPHHIDSFIVSSLLHGFLDSTNSPFQTDLRDNDVYQWLPTSPMQMTYCTQDEEVIYQNTLDAYNYFTTHGDTAVWAVDGGPLHHMDCVAPAVTNMIFFFNSYKISENNLTLTLTADSESAPGAHNAAVHAVVSGGTGYSIAWSTGSTAATVSGLSNGAYTVTVTDSKGCGKVRSITTGGRITAIPESTAALPSIQMFPNPVFSELFFQCSGFHPQEVCIYDMSGRKISEQAFGMKLDVSPLQQGVYTVEVKGAETSIRKRFVKE